MGFKVCSACNQEKELPYFEAGKNQCGECRNKATAAWRQRTPGYSQRYREYQKDWEVKNKKRRKEGSRRREILAKYGLTVEDYNKLFEQQNGCCAICKRHQSEFKKALHIDHDHVTGKVRGLLCGPHNRMLGMANDSSEILNAALAYLDVSQSNVILIKGNK